MTFLCLCRSHGTKCCHLLHQHKLQKVDKVLLFTPCHCDWDWKWVDTCGCRKRWVAILSRLGVIGPTRKIDGCPCDANWSLCLRMVGGLVAICGCLSPHDVFQPHFLAISHVSKHLINVVVCTRCITSIHLALCVHKCVQRALSTAKSVADLHSIQCQNASCIDADGQGANVALMCCFAYVDMGWSYWNSGEKSEEAVIFTWNQADPVEGDLSWLNLSRYKDDIYSAWLRVHALSCADMLEAIGHYW